MSAHHLSLTTDDFGTLAGEGADEEVLAMDEASFRTFYSRTARQLRAYLVRGAGSVELADDLLQEAYYRFLRSGFASDDETYRKNYLFRIATNLLRDHFRRSQPEVEQTMEHGDGGGHDDRLHLRSDVGRTLAELKPRERQLLWLAYVEGSSHREIAGILGLKAASIRSLLFRARQRLIVLLRERGLAPAANEEVTS